jgi:hypothetical protein
MWPCMSSGLNARPIRERPRTSDPISFILWGVDDAGMIGRVGSQTEEVRHEGSLLGMSKCEMLLITGAEHFSLRYSEHVNATPP